MTDIASWSETDASNSSAPPAGAPEGMLPSAVNDTMRAMMGAMKRLADRLQPTVTSGGTANAQTLTYTVAPSAYNAGDIYRFIVGTGLTNTGAATLNINSLGAKAVQNNGAALAGGEFTAGHLGQVYFDGTQFQLLA